MSHDYVYIIPTGLGVVPDERRRQAAVSYFRSIASEASEVTAWVSDRLEFIHCGANFGKICCPSCGSEIELDIWQEWMDHDYGEDGFTLTEHSMPCCSARYTLHELAYEWPQGFARSGIRATNPGIGELSDEQCARFETILDCPVRVIYEHA